MLLKKRNTLSTEEMNELDMYRTVYRKCNAGETITVCTEFKQDLEDLFGKYHDIFMHFINIGVLKYKVLNDIGNEEFIILG